MNLKGPIAGLILITIGYGMFNFWKSMEGRGIPMNTFMLDENHLIYSYFNHKNETVSMIKHNFNTGETTDLTENNLFQRCIPISYKNDTIAGSLNNSSPTKYCGLSLSSGNAFWLSEYPNNYKLISYQKRIDESDYDYAKLNPEVVTSKEFRGAQHLRTNSGAEVRYNDMPVIVLYAKESSIESKNIFSRTNWWKLVEVFSKKCYLGLYNEQTQKFEWVHELPIDGGAYYKMMLYYGVYNLKGDKVLLVDAKKTETLNLATGEIELKSEIK